jgi:transcriptional regulator with XRE-family HTH domain
MDVSRTIKCATFWDALMLESFLEEQGVQVHRPDEVARLSMLASGALNAITAAVAQLKTEFPASGTVIIEGEDRDEGAPQQSSAPASHTSEPSQAQRPQPQPPRAPEPPPVPGPSRASQPYSGCHPGARQGTPIAAKAHRMETDTETEAARLAMTAHAAGEERDRPRTAAAALGHGLNPLQELVHRRMREQGWSYGEVARRGGLPRSTVYTLATTRNLARPPRPATLDGLAKGLGVPVAAVRVAAAESTGLHYYDEVPAGREHPGDPERELLIASIDELTPEDRRHVAALVESLRKRASAKPANG